MLPISPLFRNERGHNRLDGGTPFYNLYVCNDGGFMSVGCLEPQFFEEFIRLFLDALPRQFSIQSGWKPTTDTYGDKDDWPNLKEFLEKGFMSNSRDYWAGVFHGTRSIPTEIVCNNIIHRRITGSDACALPVLTPTEARMLTGADAPLPAAHPQILPAVRLHGHSDVILQSGKHNREILEELGLSEEEKRRLVLDGAIGGEEARIYTRTSKL